MPSLSWRGRSRDAVTEAVSGQQSEEDSPDGVRAYYEAKRRKLVRTNLHTFDCPSAIDKDTWIYENLRILVGELNTFIVLLDEHCDITTCPRMTATEEWEYKCAAHKKARECCAVDYMTHTIDGTAALFNNSRNFPERFNKPEEKTKFFESACRRLYRLFSHAFFEHPDQFLKVEASTEVYTRFTLFALTHKLMTENLVLVPNTHFPVLIEYENSQ